MAQAVRETGKIEPSLAAILEAKLPEIGADLHVCKAMDKMSDIIPFLMMGWRQKLN